VCPLSKKKREREREREEEEKETMLVKLLILKNYRVQSSEFLVGRDVFLPSVLPCFETIWQVVFRNAI
jgi:hypothetical protein